MRGPLRLILTLAGLLWVDAGAGEPAAALVPPNLSELEARVATENSYPTATAEFHRAVLGLVESNTLVTGEDFFRAAKLAAPPIVEYRSARMRYELTLAAVALECREAETWLAMSWDGLLGTLGRPLRFDALGIAAHNPGNNAFTFEPAPKVVAAVWRNPGEARAVALKAGDNMEVQQIVDADQAVRANWGKLTPTEMQAVSAADHQRSVRVREIVTEGGLHTAKDFANASLVLQHSPAFAGYQLAHELAVCALLLGDRGLGRWLVAATYDRMLNSVGHDQRFGTQGAPTMGANKPVLRETDERGICDAERLALGCPTLAAKRADFFTRRPKG